MAVEGGVHLDYFERIPGKGRSDDYQHEELEGRMRDPYGGVGWGDFDS